MFVEDQSFNISGLKWNSLIMYSSNFDWKVFATLLTKNTDTQWKHMKYLNIFQIIQNSALPLLVVMEELDLKQLF